MGAEEAKVMTEAVEEEEEEDAAVVRAEEDIKVCRLSGKVTIGRSPIFILLLLLPN